MPTVHIPPAMILVPIFILGAMSGFKRGWRDEAWTLGALLVTVLLVARPEAVLLPALERMIGAFQRAGQALLGRDTSGPSFRFDDPLRPWAALLAFLFFVGRHLRRRENEALAGEPVWLREIEARTPIAELDAEDRAVPALTGGRPASRAQVEELVTREPERIAQQVRAWMTEE